MKQIVKAVAIVAPLLVFVGCGDGLSNPSEDVKGGELLIDFPSKLIKPGLIEKGLISDTQTVYGYKAYKIPYTTTDEEGEQVKVSGVLVVPTELPEIVTETLGLWED